MEQVWFCGAHSDVGGGYAEVDLSDVTLAWLLDRARNAGLALDPTVIGSHPLRPNAQGRLHNSKTGLYRLTPGIDRPIGLTAKSPGAPEHGSGDEDPTQSVHTSVRERWDKDPTYRPAKLRDYFKMTRDVRAVQP